MGALERSLILSNIQHARATLRTVEIGYESFYYNHNNNSYLLTYLINVKSLIYFVFLIVINGINLLHTLEDVKLEAQIPSPSCCQLGIGWLGNCSKAQK